MSRSYTIRVNDTLESISRRAYGTEIYAGLLDRANPGILDSLTPGTEIILPDIPDAPVSIAQKAPASNPSEVAIKIDSKRF